MPPKKVTQVEDPPAMMDVPDTPIEIKEPDPSVKTALVAPQQAAGVTQNVLGSLPDLPFQYLTDKSQWPDFKRSLNNCGYTWNISDWMSTIVFKGKDYNDLKTKGRFRFYFSITSRECRRKSLSSRWGKIA